MSNTFILKTYTTSEADTDYATETKAYFKLKAQSEKGRKHIPTFYGQFKHKNTYNIIIEVADKGALDEYFKITRPPSSAKDIHNFWFNLFEILYALHIIHYLKEQMGDDWKVSKGFVANIIRPIKHLY
jgi:serine/threonine protein kinase